MDTVEDVEDVEDVDLKPHRRMPFVLLGMLHSLKGNIVSWRVAAFAMHG